LFAVLRRVKPILIVKNVALVTRIEDVQEVLARDDIFQVTYGPKMRVIRRSPVGASRCSCVPRRVRTRPSSACRERNPGRRLGCRQAAIHWTIPFQSERRL
jgi:hypothetical protein